MTEFTIPLAEAECSHSIENKQLAGGLKEYRQRSERVLTLAVHSSDKYGSPWPAT